MRNQRPHTTTRPTSRRWVGALASATLVTAALSGLPAPAHAADGASAAMVDRLEQSNWLSTFQVPGVAVVQVRQGAVTWSQGYGTSNITSGDPVTTDTVFRVGSVSKSVTAWGVMRLVEQGRLDLDAPVQSYVTRWHLPPSRFDSDGVTIGRLLSHTAGLNNQDYSPVTTRPQPSLVQSLDGGSGQPGERDSDDVQLTAEPGTRFSYSNAGYSLLQLAIEEVTGEAFAAYMKREVLDPLGMTRSSFVEQPTLATVTATAYTRGGRAVRPYAFTEQAAGGLYTSASDLARFVIAGMAGPSGEVPGRGVLTPAGVDALLAPISVPGSMATSLGYEVETLSDGTSAAGHGGKNTGWLSQFTTLPGRGEGIVALTNSDSSGPIGFITQAWADSLGVGHPMPAQRLANDLSAEFTLMLALTALLGAVALGGGFLLIRGHRSGRRTWAWRGASPSSPVRRVVAAAPPLLAVAVAVAWWMYPVRVTFVSIAPVRTHVLMVSLIALCLAAVGAALTSTRRTSAADAQPLT